MFTLENMSNLLQIPSSCTSKRFIRHLQIFKRCPWIIIVQTKSSLRTLKSHYDLPTRLYCSVVTSPMHLRWFRLLLPSLVCFRQPSPSTYLSTIWGKNALLNVYWLIWGVMWVFDFHWQWVVEWVVPKLSSEFGEQFQNNPFRNYFFVDNEWRDGLFRDYSPDPDDSSRTIHSTTVMQRHHCTIDVLPLLNHRFVVNNTRRCWKPLLPQNTSTTVHLHCTSHTFLFHCFIALTYWGVKLSLQTRQFRNIFKIWKCLKKPYRCRKKQSLFQGSLFKTFC